MKNFVFLMNFTFVLSITICGCNGQQRVMFPMEKFGIGHSLDTSVLDRVTQLYPLDTNILAVLNMSDDAEYFNPFVAVFDKKMRLVDAAYFKAELIDSVFGNKIYGNLNEARSARGDIYGSELDQYEFHYTDKDSAYHYANRHIEGEFIILRSELNADGKSVFHVVTTEHLSADSSEREAQFAKASVGKSLIKREVLLKEIQFDRQRSALLTINPRMPNRRFEEVLLYFRNEVAFQGFLKQISTYFELQRAHQ